MKILEYPKDYKEVIRCEKGNSNWGEEEDYCGALLEVSVEDICYRLYRHYREYEVNKDYGVKCPCCGAFIMLSGFIPPLARANAKEYKKNE